MTYLPYQWTEETTLETDGVLVGCDANQEWLLPWWWMNFRMHSNHPVTFVDFGNMSPAAKDWCSTRGELKSLQIAESFVTPLEECEPDQAAIWKWRAKRNDNTLDIAEARSAWFKKPFACLLSPFKRTAWIDLDCQVRRPIDSLFTHCENEWGIALAEEIPSERAIHESKGQLKKGEAEYNSGVVVFKHGAPLLLEWAKMGVESNNEVSGDQEALSRMAFNRSLKLPLLPPECNWRFHIEENSDAVIIHWLGVGKMKVKGIMTFLSDNFFMNFSL